MVSLPQLASSQWAALASAWSKPPAGRYASAQTACPPTRASQRMRTALSPPTWRGARRCGWAAMPLAISRFCPNYYPDGTYSMTQANSSSGQPITPVRLIKNSDGSFTALPPPPPPPPVAVAALPQLSVKKDGSATVASAPPGFQLVTAPDGGTYLESSLDGTRVAVKHNKDGSLGLTATALGQVMASSSSSSSGVNAVGGGGLLEAAVYNYLYNGGVLPPGVHVETNSDGTVSVTTPPAKGGSSPVVSRLDLRGHRYNGGGGPSSLSAGELVGLERLLTSGGLDAGQLPPGITLVTLSDGSQSVVKNGVPTGTLLSRLANGKLGLQTTTNHNLPLGALLLSGWPVVSGISCSAAVYTSCMA